MAYQRERQEDSALSSASTSLGRPGQYDPADLDTDTMDPYLGVRMNNADPASASMYQVPHAVTGGATRKPSSEIHIDPEALKVRLQTLGLQGPSSTDLPLHDAEPEIVTPPDHYILPETYPSRRFPTAHEVYPDDSISMYRRPGQTPVGRKGGTDVDPGEVPAMYGEKPYQPDLFSEDGGITMNTPRSVPYLDPTVVPASAFTRGTYGGPGMQAMRDKLLDAQAAQQAAQAAELAAQMDDAARLASALTKLESTEEQLRTLQATLIAERVARSQSERDASLYEHDVRDIKEELASAVRALRRARNEGRKSEEERRAMLRAYEMAQAKANQYQLELSVREAVSRGREKGRQEAWDEAAKWMGVNPPLPIEPLRQITDAVFGRTPMVDGQQLPQQYAPQPSRPILQSPPNAYGQVTPLQQEPQMQQQGMFQPLTMPSPHNSHQTQQFYSGSGGMHATPDFARPQNVQPGSQYLSPGGQGGQPLQHIAAPMLAPQSLRPQHTGIGLSQHPSQATMQTPHPQQHTWDPRLTGQASSYIHGAVPPPHPAETRSVPSQHAPLPQQQQPQRAATVVSQARRHVSQPPPVRHEAHAADEYLDRVEHDRRVQEMLQGTRLKSVPTSQYPTTRATEKPLPEPFEARTPGKATTNRPSVAGTAATGAGRSRHRPSLAEGMHPSIVMHSIPDGDRYPAFPGAPPHGGLTHVGQRAHSRNTSFGSVDPAAYALPASTAQSMHHTPQAFTRQPTSTAHSNNKTPKSGGDARSRMADALRYGHGLDPPPGNLSQIDEEEAAGQRILPSGGEREREFAESTIMRNVSEAPQQPRGMPSMPPPKHQPRPIMPSMLSGKAASEVHTSGPRPSRGHQHSQSAVGTGPRGDDPPFSHPLFVPPGMAPMAVSGGIDDVQGPRHSALGLEGIETQSGGANALGQGGYSGGTTEDAYERGGFGGFLSKIVKAPTITVQPPSTQSKSNIPSDETQAPRDVSASAPPAVSPSRSTRVIAESKSTSIDPPLISRQTVTTTEIFQDPAATVPAPKSVKAHEVPLPRSRAPTMSTGAPVPQSIAVPSSLAPTAVIAPTPRAAQQQGKKQAHEIPLPHSRAPTVISGYEPVASQRSPAIRPRTPRQGPPAKSRPATTATSAQAFNIPLPRSRSQAPTAYDGASPDLLSPQTDRSAWSHRSAARSRAGDGAASSKSHPFGPLPNVSVIDFALTDAMARPLPESRATTMYGTPSVFSPPQRARSEMEENTKRNAKSAVKRKPIPEQVPLPPSRAPTVRPRVSMYARTEGTIDEVTEEESGKENHAGRKRW